MNKKGLNLPYLPYALALGLFLALLIAGFLLSKDFGVPVDEPSLIQFAIENHRYIFNSDPTILSNKYRFYGMVFELPLFWASTRFSGPDMVHARHLFLYLAFFASTAIFYFISLRLFRSPWWSLVAACFLAASPRIFSDAFYNSKDIAFMDVFILAIGTLLLVIGKISKPGWLYPILLVCLHALTSALLIGTRIVGIMILPRRRYRVPRCGPYSTGWSPC